MPTQAVSRWVRWALRLPRRRRRSEDLPYPLEPEAILPEQIPRRRRRERPELKLWAAVLAQAVTDFLRPNGVKYDRTARRRSDRLIEEAREWISSESRQVGSFIWTCELLGFEPSAVRERLSALACARSSTSTTLRRAS
jgi:hypothetical protein